VLAPPEQPPAGPLDLLDGAVELAAVGQPEPEVVDAARTAGPVGRLG